MTKRKPKSQHKKSGSPTKMTDAKLTELKTAFSLGMNDKEACLFANISVHTLIRYVKKNPKFGELKEELKNTPSMQAKQTIVNAINGGSSKDAQRRLERKNKEEFGTKQEIDLKATTETQHTVNIVKIDEILGNLGYSKS